MIRYWRLLKAIAKYRLMREMEFAANLLIGGFIHLFFVMATLSFFMVIWFRVGSFGGLNPYQMLFFFGTFTVINGLYMVFAYFGIMEIPELIRGGDMDFMLIKPVSSQFLVTLRSFSWIAFIDILVGVLFICYAIIKIKLVFTLSNFIVYLAMLVNGALISYALACMVMTLSFSMVAVDSVLAIFNEFNEFSKTPMGVFPSSIRTVLSIFLPMLIVGNFPSYFGLGKLNLWQVLWFFAISIILVYLSHRFWQSNLKKYHSASS